MVLNNSGLLRMVFKSQYCLIYLGLTQISIWKLHEMHRFYPGTLHRGSFFPLVSESSQDITFKSFKCINSQIMLLKQLLMPVAELVGTTIPTGSLAAFYIALLSLHFMDLGVKIKKKSLLEKKI